MNAMPSSTVNSNGDMPDLRKPGRKGSKAAVAEVELPPYEPDIPEPTTRAELMKYWMPLSLDERTSQKLLWISEGGMKVSRMSDEVCPILDRPERYEHAPQVLCKEGLLGTRGYWEVDYDGWVVIGVAYESSNRKTKDGPCGLGENNASWAVGWAGSCYHIWHDGENVEVPGKFCKTFGIYVDHPAGILCFYLVEETEDGAREVQMLHHFKTTFKDKVLPGFWIGRKSFCQIRKKDQ